MYARTCKGCGNGFSSCVRIDGIKRNLGGRTFCLSCSPFGERKRAQANRLARIRQHLELGSPSGDILDRCILCKKLVGGRRRRCTACSTKIRRYRLKLAGIKLLGGKCKDCGWAGEPAGFDFHHLNENEKSFSISRESNKSWSELKAEILKCDLLCARCHRLRHAKKDEVFIKEAMEYNGDILELV